MDNIEFQRLLLRTAILAMSADGKIQIEEIDVIKKIAIDSNYFKDINSKKEMENIFNDIEIDLKTTFQKYISFFENNFLSVSEVLLLFEVLLKVINADMIVTKEEKYFIQVLRSKFRYIPNDIFTSRFGDNEYFNLEIENPYIAFQKPYLKDNKLNDFLDGEIKGIENPDKK